MTAPQAIALLESWSEERNPTDPAEWDALWS